MVTTPEQELDGELVQILAPAKKMEMGTELAPKKDQEIGPQLEPKKEVQVALVLGPGLVENATRKKKTFLYEIK